MPHHPSYRLGLPARLSALGVALAGALPVQAAPAMPTADILAGLPGALIATLALGYALWTRRQGGRAQAQLQELRQQYEALKQTLVPALPPPAPQRCDQQERLSDTLELPCRDEERMEILLLDLHHALPREQLSPRFRVNYDLRCQRVSGFEARLHWRHTQLGALEPKEFLPLAEASGLITTLDEWLLYRACMQAAQWQGRFPGMRIMVRLAAATVAGPDLVGNLLQILADTGLAGEDLELLVPDSIFSHPDQESLLANLTALGELGVVITLDEVQPLTLPFDRLQTYKIHKLRLGSRLTEDMLENPDSATVVGTLVELGHQLGLTVLADGIGNGKQVRYLRGLGCDQAQGDYFSLALPAEELHLLLCQRRQVA